MYMTEKNRYRIVDVILWLNNKDYTLEEYLHYLVVTQNGFIFQLIHCLFIILFQLYKINLEDFSIFTDKISLNKVI